MLETAVDVVVPVVLLDVLGLVLNAWLLYIIKVRTPVFNAIDVIQVFKIVFVTSALVFTVWFEFLPCQQQTSVLSTKICIEIQEFTDDCFFHSICWMLVTVALVRKKVCECRGRASVLVTRRYGIKTLVLCLTPGCLFMAVSGTLLFQGEVPVETTPSEVNNNSTDSKTMWSRVTAISTRSSIVFTVCHAVVLGFLPLSLLCGLYLKISGIVRHTAQTASELVPIRNRDPFKNIIRSLVIHLTLSCSLWATYLAVRIIEVSTDLNHAYIVFTKLVILIAHPFGEGLLQPSFKKQTEVVHRHIQARSHRRIVPNSNASFSDFRTFIDERSTIAGDWTRPTRGPGRKISDHSSGGGGTGSVFKHRSATNDASSLKSHGKGRKESREDLRKALKLLGGDDPMEYSRIRRLSTSLRFSTTSYPAHDMYDSYSMVNHSPVLSSLRRQMVNNNVCEGYISPDTVIKDFKDFDSDSPSPSRSHRRWKRLLTTARTVKRFSRTRLTSNSPLESCLEEADDPVGVGNKRTDANRSTRKRHTSGSDMDKMRLSNKLDNYASWTAKDSKNNKVDNITRSDALLGPSRQTARNHVSASHDSTMQTRKRARAISCVNNEWLQHQQEKDKRAQRKESLEETIVIETDQASPLNRADLIRSMSYDAKIRFRVANGATGGAEPERREKRRVSRRQSRYSRHSRGDVEAVDVKATRNECIKRLQDMSEYF